MMIVLIFLGNFGINFAKKKYNMKQNVMEPSFEQGQDGGHSTSFIRDLCHHSNGKLIYKKIKQIVYYSCDINKRPIKMNTIEE